MNTTHPHHRLAVAPTRRWARTCLLACAAVLAFAAQANDDWDQAQAAFAELDDRAALGHLQRAAAAGDARAQQALALALRHGDRLFPGVLATDLAAPATAARWPPTCCRRRATAACIRWWTVLKATWTARAGAG